MNPAKTQSNPRQMPIILLTLATALIHLVLLNIMLVNAAMGISIPFILNGLGYLALLPAYTLPLPWVKEQRNLVSAGLSSDLRRSPSCYRSSWAPEISSAMLTS